MEQMVCEIKNVKWKSKNELNEDDKSRPSRRRLRGKYIGFTG